jgi:hypothetical protein
MPHCGAPGRNTHTTASAAPPRGKIEDRPPFAASVAQLPAHEGSPPGIGHHEGRVGRPTAHPRHNHPMDRYERILALHRTLKSARYPVTVPRL